MDPANGVGVVTHLPVAIPTDPCTRGPNKKMFLQKMLSNIYQLISVSVHGNS